MHAIETTVIETIVAVPCAHNHGKQDRRPGTRGVSEA